MDSLRRTVIGGLVAAALCAFLGTAGLAAEGGADDSRQVAPPKDVAPATPPVITTVAISADGRLMASGGDDHIVRIWSLADGKLRNKLEGHRDWVRTVVFSPDGSTLASGGDDHCVRLWDVATGKLKRELTEATDAVYCLRYSPDGAELAAVGFEADMRIYDGRDGTLLRRLDGPCFDLRAVAFSSTGHHLACAGRNGQIRVWSLANPAEPPRDVMKGHSRRIRCVCFSPNGKQLASAGEDGRVKIWDARKGTKEAEFRAGPAKVMSLLFYADNRLATGGSDNVIRLWDPAKGKEIRQLVGHTGSVSALASDPAGKTLVSGSFDTTIRVWPLGPSAATDATALMDYRALRP